MCCKNKEARRAYKQARRSENLAYKEGRCGTRCDRPAQPILVYERRPGLIRLIVEHFLQSRSSRQAPIQHASAYESMPQTTGTIQGSKEMEKDDYGMLGNTRPESTVELPSYGQAMKQ
ncbi:hypothetical protein ONS95_013917 [Cadophora gregata]|uniref:uncharacterized protein n=1 Tax=Cadophora gregata TaxID=51156 RepID=UPI0026DCBD54|nr:uncharacterized protein ONS95_013917 [Cadophora gregata]KAK0113669.1 hypothetical protein ONS96_014524 [Cadophora gregata f. sp. sojae]KAK0114426.1 hypothetical protein ONS95_013917 [Cadophora gregata]